MQCDNEYMNINSIKNTDDNGVITDENDEAHTSVPQYLSFWLNHSDIWLHVDRRGKPVWLTHIHDRSYYTY